MSQRESPVHSISLLEIGGVNERRTATELPPAEYSSILGIYPEYVNQQTRIPGKRLLHKYSLPIWGIFQFWTPLGYANGLYQFESELDAGPWLTPNSNIVIPPLGSSLPIDGDGNTVNDFGLSTGGPITPPPGDLENVGTPDDRNGGPAGQGKYCSWTSSTQDLLATFNSWVATCEFGYVTSDTIIGTVPPVPLPVPLPSPTAIPYLPFVGDFVTKVYAQQELGSDTDASIPPGAHEYVTCQGGKFSFDFATLQTLPGFDRVTITVSREVHTFGVPPIAPVITEIPLVSGQEFIFNDWLPASTPASIRNVGTGYQQVLYVIVTAFTAYFRNRTCV